MRIFLLSVLTVAALFVWQRQSHPPAPPAKADHPKPSTASETPDPTSSRSALMGPLARTREVTEQVRKSRRGAKRYRR